MLGKCWKALLATAMALLPVAVYSLSSGHEEGRTAVFMGRTLEPSTAVLAIALAVRVVAYASGRWRSRNGASCSNTPSTAWWHRVLMSTVSFFTRTTWRIFEAAIVTVALAVAAKLDLLDSAAAALISILIL